jgi:hypothetical protein
VKVFEDDEKDKGSKVMSVPYNFRSSHNLHLVGGGTQKQGCMDKSMDQTVICTMTCHSLSIACSTPSVVHCAAVQRRSRKKRIQSSNMLCIEWFVHGNIIA